MAIIRIEGLSFEYEKEMPVLKDINADFEEGDIIAILGKNGCGKSTLLNCILGINHSSNIYIEDINITKYSDKALAKKIAYVPQSTNINIDYSVRDFVSFARNPYKDLFKGLTKNDYALIEENAKICGIENLLNKDITKLSGGEKQLVFIARALTQDTKIIIMDEPTAALDFGNQQRFYKLIKELKSRGKTIIFTTHNPNHLMYMDIRVYGMKEGRLRRIEKLSLKVINDLYGQEFKYRDNFFDFNL